MSIARIHQIISHLEQQSTTEALTVSEMLNGILNDDEDVSPEFLVICLDELIGWAKYAKKELAPRP